MSEENVSVGQEAHSQNVEKETSNIDSEDLGITNRPPFDRDIFAIAGAAPEVVAVAMAKYSRSPLSVKEILADLTEEKSAEFHEKWVIGYGDASVADMAQIQLACENVSILASKVLEDNRLASYQEKSTRYQKFDRGRFYKPRKIMESNLAALYEDHCNYLFDTYLKILDKMMSYFRQKYPNSENMSEKLYESKIKARSLDVARYVLPVSTLTNLGFSINARGLRHAISKLLGHELEEMKEIGADLTKAALTAAYNPKVRKIKTILDEIASGGSDIIKQKTEELAKLASLEVKGAPTLIKHTEPREYISKIKYLAKHYADELLKFQDINQEKEINDKEKVYGVDYVDEQISYEDELITTFMYAHSKYSFTQILSIVKSLSVAKKEEILETLGDARGKFDWLSREYEVPNGLIFDTFMDYGAFRDIQRHRLCTQINQELTIDHGYYTPEEIIEAGCQELLHEAMVENVKVYKQIAENFGAEAQYVISMGFKKRTLFKMNLRELNHIIELRSKPGGHIAYRWLVYEMYERFKDKHPTLMKHSRVEKPDYGRDFFLR
jgi:thymidylate synthase ThyX